MIRRRGWTIARRSIALLFLSALVLGGAEMFALAVGTTVAVRWFGAVPFVDPEAALEAALAGGGVGGDLLFGALLTAGVAVLLGPVFCGWLCPAALAFDIWNRLRRSLGRRGRHAPSGRPPRATARCPGLRLAVLLFVLAFSATAGWPLAATFSPPHMLSRALVHGSLLGIGALAALLLLETLRPGLWCGSLCPTGAAYSLLGGRAPLRVRLTKMCPPRSACGLCSSSCPLGIDVLGIYAARGAASVDDPACTRCGACVESCPRAIVRLGWRDRPTARAGTEPSHAPAGGPLPRRAPGHEA